MGVGESGGGLKQYGTWNISMSRYFLGDVEKGLVTALRNAGLRKKLGRDIFTGKGIEVHLESAGGAMSRLKVDMYVNGQAEPQEIEGAIRAEIEDQRLVSDVKFTKY